MIHQGDRMSSSIEDKLLPPFIIFSLVIHVLSMRLTKWMEAFYGDVSVTKFSPWFLCNLNCLQCSTTKPHTDCFWMQDWANTGFDLLGIVQYLEYWCVGALVLSLIPAILVSCGLLCKSNKCEFDIRRPMLLLLFVAAFLSTFSVSLFGSKISQYADVLSNYQGLRSQFGSSFYVRVLGTVFIWFSCFIAVIQECKVKNQVHSQQDSYMIVTQSRTIEEILDDEDEEDGQLL